MNKNDQLRLVKEVFNRSQGPVGFWPAQLDSNERPSSYKGVTSNIPKSLLGRKQSFGALRIKNFLDISIHLKSSDQNQRQG